MVHARKELPGLADALIAVAVAVFMSVLEPSPGLHVPSPETAIFNVAMSCAKFARIVALADAVTVVAAEFASANVAAPAVTVQLTKWKFALGVASIA